MLSALRITQINLYKHLSTVNFWTPFILAIAAVYEFTYSLSDMSKAYSVPINGFSAAFIFVDTNTVFILFIGIFILFSDLPFKDNQQMFLISRSGKRAWIFSQVLYVIFVSLIYFTFIFLNFCAVLFPDIAFSADNWGKIIRTISATNAYQKFGLRFTIPAGVLSSFKPLEGFLYAFGTAFAAAVILGITVLLFNLIVKRSMGVILSGTIVFMIMISSAPYLGRRLVFYFSPLSWCSLFKTDKNGTTPFPDLNWVIAVLCIWFTAEIAALYIFGGRRMKFSMDLKEELE